MGSFGVALAVVAALRVPGPLSPRLANYRIEASLDEAAHVVRGRERLSWRNDGTQPASTLVLHLYLNAFKNDQTAFFRESHGQHRRAHAHEHGWGAIDVTRVTVGGVDLTARLAVDETLARLPLPAPVAPGAAIEVELEFTSTLPRVFARTGWSDGFFAVAQWFPKIAVWECGKSPQCRWRAEQLHLDSEFFADFGVYDVTLEVPAGLRVAATGVLVDESTAGARTTERWRAEDVTDFAWFASRRFAVDDAVVQDALGALRVRLYAWPGHETCRARHLEMVRAGLAELERRLGPYPYAQLTVVDVPDDADGAGGMEYPTLFTTESFPVPASIHACEYVTAHELAHQWFQGMVSSDEAAEAWLDEGLTETMTDVLLSARFGAARAVYDFAGHRISLSDGERLSYARAADRDPPETPSWAFLDDHTYGAISYAKIDVVLRTLEGLLGPARVEAGLRRYFEGARFRHPGQADFERLFEEGADAALGSFFHATLDGTGVVDYEVLEVRAEPVRTTAGLVEVGGARVEASPAPRPDGAWRSEVVVHRKGTLPLPVDVRVVFDDGSERRERWDDQDGAPRWRRYSYEAPRPVAWAEVDPDKKLTLEIARLDDGLRRAPDAGPRRRALAWWQGLLSAALAAVGF